MVDANNVSLQVQQPHQANPTLQPLFHALDPISLILNQNSGSDHPVPLRLTSTESFVMERGPRYEAYAELRETKLRRKCRRQQQEEEQEQEPEELELKQITPPRRKQVKFQAGLVSGRKGSSVVAQSVPDFAAALRKENRKPLNALPSMVETTPPSKSCFSKGNNGVSSNSRGSKSANAGEKKRGGAVLMARKSYASIDELRGLSLATANAISGEARGGGGGGGRRYSSRVMGKTVSGYRQF